MSRYLDASTKTRMTLIMVQYRRPSSRPSRAKSVRSSFGKTVMGKAIWENPVAARLGEGFQLGMLIRTPWERTILICVCGRFQNWLGRNRALTHCGKYSRETLIWENRHHSLTMIIWAALKENVRQAKILWTITGICSNPGSLPWKVMKRNAWKDIANWRIKQLSNYTKSQRHAWMFREEEKGSVGELSKGMLTNCSEMSVFGSYW